MSPAPAAKKAASKRKPKAAATKASPRAKATAKGKAAPGRKAAPKAKAAPRVKAKAAAKRTPAVAGATATAKPKAKSATTRAKPKAAARAKATSAAGGRVAAKPKGRAAARGACLVVGYDGSASGRAAVAWATDVLPADGKIVLVHACKPLHAPTSPLASASARREFGRALLDELLLDGPKRMLDREVVAEVADKDPVSALASAARRHGANGIVVGCKRHSRLRKAIGTVTSDLLKSSPVPVTAVPR